MPSKIEWTQDTWNTVVGCSKVSPGCKHCYAMKMAYRLMHSPNAAIAEKYEGTAINKQRGVQWTGRVNMVADALAKPLKTKKPTTFFVNSMGDTFHDDVPFDFIDKIFLEMYLTPIHTFQVLTKRANRMADYFLWKSNGEGLVFPDWPLKNVWIGVTVENQEAADERIPKLLEIPAAVRFLSVEPLLGPVDLDFTVNDHKRGPARLSAVEAVDWVILGGESGGKARPMQIDWAMKVKNQCLQAGVPFFFKQWGEYDSAGNKVGKAHSGNLLDGKQYKQMPTITQEF